MSSADARGGAPAERFRLVRRLGARAVPTWAALDTSAGDKPRLVVVERVTRGGDHGDQDIADWVRDARRLATLEHPNVGRVRDVVISGEEVSIVSDYLDGVRWSELMAAEPRPALEAALRVLVDVLTGLGAIHNLRDAKREPLKLVHGELTPDCIVIGTDGGGRIVSPARLRAATATARPARSGSAYLAPEILLADESANARADVYSVGVLLWELLSGRPLFPDAQPSAIVTHLLSGRVPLATIPQGHAWAAPLAGLAARALSADPAKRFTSAAAMAAEIRRIAGPKLAPQANLAAHVRGAFGDRIRARREELERGEARPAPEGVDAELASEDIRISVVPTPVPPPPTATTKPPPPVEPPPLPQRGQPAPAKVSAPTPYVAFDIPLAARIPKDLQPGVGEIPVPAPAPAPRSQSPAPAVPPVVTAVQEADAPPRKRPKGVVLALLAGPVVLVAALLVWWLASPSSDEGRHAASSASTTATVAEAPHPPPAPTTPTPAAAAETVAPQPQAVPTESTAPATAAAAETPAAPANAAPLSPLTPAPTGAPAPPARSPQRPKYEPEGI